MAALHVIGVLRKPNQCNMERSNFDLGPCLFSWRRAHRRLFLFVSAPVELCRGRAVSCAKDGLAMKGRWFL